nr:MAG TPA: replisome organizer [Caudoviricetes sp.]
MAERRMIAKSIIKSDQFLDMPATTQCLYFHLLLEADDDGFINAPKSIMRVIGAKDDDMRVLQAKGYIIPFESGVIVIKHWRLHNSLRKDRYNPNPQLENERKQLVVADNKEYQLATNWQPNGNQLATSSIPLVATGKDRLGKDRLGKDREEEEKEDPRSAELVTF